MFCKGCEKELDNKDFLPQQEKCFKCVYKQKTGTDKASKKCKHCGCSIFAKRRISYCSEECSRIGTKNLRQNLWLEEYKGAPGFF
jgi:hypothetical protein